MTWTLGLLCYDPATRRWLFARWEVYTCATAHYEYCTRKDRTRNLRVEATSCTPVEPPVCRGSRTRCEKTLEETLAGAIAAAEKHAETLLEQCLGCFGLETLDVEVGYHAETEDTTTCMYDRCDTLWRTRLEDCVFKRI